MRWSSRKQNFVYVITLSIDVRGREARSQVEMNFHALKNHNLVIETKLEVMEELLEFIQREAKT